MPKKTAPGIGLALGWNLGEGGADVKSELDRNALLTSVLVNLSVKSRKTALPASPGDGDRYLVPANAQANANQLAVRFDGAWVYFAPQRNWSARVEDESDALVVYSGTAWAVSSTATSGGSSGGSALPSVGLTAIQQSPPSSNADFDFLSLTIAAADLKAGLVLEALFTGTQSQAASSQNLIFYAKINDGTAITLGQVGTGASAQNYRAISGMAMLTLLATGASGSYTLGGHLQINGLVPYSSNSASPRNVDASTQLKLTIGVRCSVADAANINNITNATIKRVV